MKYLIVVAVLTILTISDAVPAFAAQLIWDARTQSGQFEPKFTFQRTVSIEYEEGSVLSDELRSKRVLEHLTADSTTNGISELVRKINQNLQESGSHVTVSDVKIEYSATLVGGENSASIDYRIVMLPVIDSFVIRQYSPSSTALLDMSWRAMRVDGPVMLSDTEREVEINLPMSLLERNFPSVYDELAGTRAEDLLSASLMDASGVGLPLGKWHSLFDPTPLIADAKRFGFEGDVITTYSMGESRIGAPTKEKVQEVEVDGKYRIVSIESADSATVFVPGYASPDVALGLEVIGTSPIPLGGSPGNDQGQFPVFVMYGMAGTAAAGAAGFFVWSSKKARQDSEQGQSGIDPACLRGMQTSSASGAYHTNRGEAQLEGDYEKTETVYKNEGKIPKG